MIGWWSLFKLTLLFLLLFVNLLLRQKKAVREEEKEQQEEAVLCTHRGRTSITTLIECCLHSIITRFRGSFLILATNSLTILCSTMSSDIIHFRLVHPRISRKSCYSSTTVAPSGVQFEINSKSSKLQRVATPLMMVPIEFRPTTPWGVMLASKNGSFLRLKPDCRLRNSFLEAFRRNNRPL